jgi:5-methylcytosine-specific restriction protein A
MIEADVMKGFICTWNPDLWEWPDTDFQSAIERTDRGEAVADRWSVGNRVGGIFPGDRVFLLRQRHDRGIVASGEFTSEVFPDAHWDESGRDANYALISWDTVLIPDDRLPVEVLKRRVPMMPWDRVQAGGVLLAPRVLRRVETLWADALTAVGREVLMLPNEVARADVVFEGSVTRIEVNRYERDRRARVACLQHWGYDCAVCGFNFAERYGRRGEQFIHVHHLRELSSLGENYEIDPTRDLRPVCPNCHAMLHTRRPALRIEDLRKDLRL